ncbi:Putative metal-binding domain of cation transport ATPase [Chromobacterium violaceum]|uniref:Metal-binding domain of cation transport ATPase n=1 Tax=Chromobacterium violaceum TaxID=536 RepID=A0A3S4JWP2_CHRVL|nr:Putative metal-binding domain of cation transport ATPase [Chromobacterium violaceum]
MSENCFHCGLPVPAGASFPIRYRQREEPACCAGCQAVAATIIESGLSDYYKHRTEGAARAEALPQAVLEQIKLYNSEELQRGFVRVESENIREASLMLEGITCAACIWLNEQHIRRLPACWAWTSTTAPSAPACAGTTAACSCPPSWRRWRR